MNLEPATMRLSIVTFEAVGSSRAQEKQQSNRSRSQPPPAALHRGDHLDVTDVVDGPFIMNERWQIEAAAARYPTERWVACRRWPTIEFARRLAAEWAP
jgi:hypothetical protein